MDLTLFQIHDDRGDGPHLLDFRMLNIPTADWILATAVNQAVLHVVDREINKS